MFLLGEVTMYKYVAVRAALVIIAVILLLSFATGQASDVETPTGDVWPSREELICIPQAAVVPSTADDVTMPWKNAVPPSDRVPFEAKRTTSNHPIRAVRPGGAARSGKSRTPRHGQLAGAPAHRDCAQK